MKTGNVQLHNTHRNSLMYSATWSDDVKCSTWSTILLQHFRHTLFQHCRSISSYIATHNIHQLSVPVSFTYFNFSFHLLIYSLTCLFTYYSGWFNWPCIVPVEARTSSKVPLLYSAFLEVLYNDSNPVDMNVLNEFSDAVSRSHKTSVANHVTISIRDQDVLDTEWYGILEFSVPLNTV